MRSLGLVALSIILLTSIDLQGSPQGKIDAGFVHLEADLKLSSVVRGKSSMSGISSSGTLCFCNEFELPSYLDGLAIKPRLLLAGGDGDVWNLGLGVGYYVPVGCFGILPSVGIAYGELEADVSIPFLGKQEVLFESRSPYVGLDLCMTLDNWLFSFMLEYAWPNTRTTLGGVNQGRAESRGFNWAAQVDYYLTCHWSVNVTYAVNESRDKERNGMLVKGGRVGLGYTF